MNTQVQARHVSATRVSLIVGAIGPFEMTEYVGLAAIYGSLVLAFRPSRTTEE